MWQQKHLLFCFDSLNNNSMALHPVVVNATEPVKIVSFDDVTLMSSGLSVIGLKRPTSVIAI